MLISQILRLPENLVTSDFKQHRISSQYDTAVIREYESVVQDWIQAIDGVLSEGSDERYISNNRVTRPCPGRLLIPF